MEITQMISTIGMYYYSQVDKIIIKSFDFVRFQHLNMETEKKNLNTETK